MARIEGIDPHQTSFLMPQVFKKARSIQLEGADREKEWMQLRKRWGIFTRAPRRVLLVEFPGFRNRIKSPGVRPQQLFPRQHGRSVCTEISNCRRDVR